MTNTGTKKGSIMK